MHKTLFKYVPVIFVGLLLVISSKLPISFVWGSYKFSFTALTAILPLLGTFYGLGHSLLFTSLLFTGKFILLGSSITFGIPTLFATASMAVQTTKSSKVLNFTLHVLLPSACMMLFTFHPIGRHASVYSWYWLIPIGIYMTSSRSFFLSALSSTFIAHAVGSIIWLYSVPMTAEQWLGLLPIVAIERITFTCLTSLLYLSINFIKNHITLKNYLLKKLYLS